MKFSLFVLTLLLSSTAFASEIYQCANFGDPARTSITIDLGTNSAVVKDKYGSKPYELSENPMGHPPGNLLVFEGLYLVDTGKQIRFNPQDSTVTFYDYSLETDNGPTLGPVACHTVDRMVRYLNTAGQIMMSLDGFNDPTSGSFSFDEGQQDFSNGTAPTGQQLLGTWITVALAQVPGFDDTSSPDSYDPSGLKNSDGSTRELNFSRARKFDDALQIAVLVTNQGAKDVNQGPTPVEFVANSAGFGQWSYDAESQINQSAHFDYYCRLLDGNANKMVCAIKFRVDDSENVEDAEVPFDGQTVYYEGFVRQ